MLISGHIGVNYTTHWVNTLRPRQNGRHFADDNFKHIFLNENVRISSKISLKFVPNGPINNIPALVQIMAWRRPGDKPLSEPMMVRLSTHIYVTRAQWVKPLSVMIYLMRSGSVDHEVGRVPVIWRGSSCEISERYSIIFHMKWRIVFQIRKKFYSWTKHPGQGILIEYFDIYKMYWQIHMTIITWKFDQFQTISISKCISQRFVVSITNPNLMPTRATHSLWRIAVYVWITTKPWN